MPLDGCVILGYTSRDSWRLKNSRLYTREPRWDTSTTLDLEIAWAARLDSVVVKVYLRLVFTLSDAD